MNENREYEGIIQFWTSSPFRKRNVETIRVSGDFTNLMKTRSLLLLFGLTLFTFWRREIIFAIHPIYSISPICRIADQTSVPCSASTIFAKINANQTISIF